MLQSIVNLLFGCAHRRTTFPQTPGRRNSALGAWSGTYVVCLDCGKEFAYNWNEMRVGQQVAEPVPAAAPQAQPAFRFRS